MVYQAAWMLDQGLDTREQIAMVKVLAAWAFAKSCP
jgi:hypothetical protein